MGKKIFTSFIIFLLITSSLTAQKISPVDANSSSIKQNLEPSKRLSIEGELTSVTIECNVSDAEVFFNGVYAGRTDLVLKDLDPGYYLVEVRKRGYVAESCMIRVRRGYDLHYYIKLEKIYGTIVLKNVPNGSVVTVDNSQSVTSVVASAFFHDYRVKTLPGRQTVYVRCFGYETYERTVDVRPFDESTLYVELYPAAFELSDLSANKKAFNPDYAGHLGSCTFSFSVTADSSAYVYITNEAGEEVWNKSYSSFSTWEQSFEWNGKDFNGLALEDGEYCVQIEAGGYADYIYVTLDRSIVYPILTAGKSGAGIGEVPAVFAENANFVMVHLDGSMEGLSAAAVSGGILFNFLKHGEISATLGGYPYYETSPMQVTVSMKAYSKEKLENVTLCYGALFRYGLSTDPLPYSEYGYDTGNGIGGGVLFGMDFGKFYVGMASQVTGIEHFWTNGLCMSIKPVNSVKMGLWGNYVVHGCIRAGTEFCFMPESSAFIVNAKVGATIAPSKAFPNFGIGLSYLF